VWCGAGPRAFFEPTCGSSRNEIEVLGTSLEFSRPPGWVWRAVYGEYLVRALPRVAWLVSSYPDAYAYLAESIRAWPSQRDLSRLIAAAGWCRVEHRNLVGGIVALHRARQPG
jgi:demethylmenaquinone methyltransferase/2-methoxy-6-polyprenyl-1,4-benzoquinol methylase